MILGLIALLFIFTRLFKIAQVPASLYWDEASIGYNAYSIGIDGKDEWGNFLPLHFRAFGEFKLPVYIYSAAISEKILGPSIFSVRLPSVLYSLAALFLIYFIVKKLFNKEAATFSALFFTIVPWDFIFSKAGYEVSAGMGFFLLGIYLFLKTDKKPFLFIISTLSFILSFYSYNSFRIISPIFLAIFGLIFILKKNLSIKSKILYIGTGVFLFLLALVPVYRLYKYDSGASRFYQVQAGNYFQTAKNYVSHFSPSFLFVSGDTNLRSNNPGFGELYWISLPFILIGIYVIIKKRSAYWWLPIVGIILGPLPAAITKESPHALRSISMLPFFTMVIGVGITHFLSLFKRNTLIVSIVIVFALLFSFESYYTNFLTKYPIESASDWQYGYKKIFDEYSVSFDKYKRIIISDEYGQPYIFALFYQKFNPETFRSTAIYNPVGNWGFSTIRSFDKFVFKKVASADLQKDTLIFATYTDKIENITPKGEISNPDGSTSFWVYSK